MPILRGIAAPAAERCEPAVSIGRERIAAVRNRVMADCDQGLMSVAKSGENSL